MFELAPQYAGVSMGLSNTLGSLPGVISPILTGFLVQNKLASEWRMVFYIAAAISLFGAIVFGIFASGVEQPWATKKQGTAYDNPVTITTDDELKKDPQQP